VSFKHNNIAKYKILPSIKKKGITTINYLVITHPHADHMGELIYFLNNINVNNLVLNIESFPLELLKEVTTKCKEKKINILDVNQVKKIDIDNSKISFLNSFIPLSDDKNEHSIVTLIEYNGINILLMGDATVNNEDILLKRYNLPKIDILKVGHHGSRTSSSKLFIKDIDEEMEKWVGKSIRPEEGKQISGVEDVAFISTFNLFLNKTFNNLVEVNLYLDIDREDFNSLKNIVGEFANEVKGKYPFANIRNLAPLIAPLRLIKSKEEIEEIKKAINITIEGVNSLMKNCKEGMKEYELEAYFDFVCKSNGVKDFAFKTIAAAGKNATILHYVDNNCDIKDGDLILFDLGAQYNYYNGDISRTFPVSGKFSDRQKEVYNAVLRVNEKVINEIKPGVGFLELNKKAKEWIAEECIALGLIKDEADVSNYYWHSIGHSL
ncbi:MAG: aminopeptidase P N-terminal domain-containing protein, partial [Mixta calida]|nr:aminopeptidase P N-terminal domain-containing protein [Mixta calida]